MADGRHRFQIHVGAYLNYSIIPAVYNTEIWCLVLGFRLSLDSFPRAFIHAVRTAVARNPCISQAFLLTFRAGLQLILCGYVFWNSVSSERLNLLPNNPHYRIERGAVCRRALHRPLINKVDVEMRWAKWWCPIHSQQYMQSPEVCRPMTDIACAFFTVWRYRPTQSTAGHKSRTNTLSKNGARTLCLITLANVDQF